MNLSSTKSILVLGIQEAGRASGTQVVWVVPRNLRGDQDICRKRYGSTKKSDKKYNIENNKGRNMEGRKERGKKERKKKGRKEERKKERRKERKKNREKEFGISTNFPLLFMKAKLFTMTTKM